MPQKTIGRPSHWKEAPWEQMAQENPLFAVMTTDEMAGAPPAEFTREQVEMLFEKGRRVFRRHLAGALAHAPDSKEEGLFVEYGCGVGRMLNAALEAGFRRVAGIDISPTMLAHCRRLVPEVEALYPLDADGHVDLPDACAAGVFSFAVVQHISLLSRYLTAFDEMCRILKPGGVLVVQLNCTDFPDGDFEHPGSTQNHETHSLHFRRGEDEPYLRHEYDYIGAPWSEGATPPDQRVGNGGFSIRSRRLLEALRDPELDYDPTRGEDQLICHTLRPVLEARHGIRFAPLDIAQRFSFERDGPVHPTFGFHGHFNLPLAMPEQDLHWAMERIPERLWTEGWIQRWVARTHKAGRHDLARRLHRHCMEAFPERTADWAPPRR